MAPSVKTASGGQVVALADESYPAWLRVIPDPPAVLYVDGQIEARDRQAVAIVGARKATPYGLRITDQLARELSGAGFTIVSGFARGIDAAAHQAALEAGGRTLAVLGCGLNVDYPPGHAGLRDEIAAGGAMITEFAPDTPPRAGNFPKRNRIISGLALGVLVVEATEESGSLITARLALEQGREVFAVPGALDSPLSRGPHGLIKQGAKLVETVDDILEELLPQLMRTDAAGADRPKKISRASKQMRAVPEPPDLSCEEQNLLSLLCPEPLHLDALTEDSHLTSAAVAGILLRLELKGLIRQLPGQRYHLVG